MIPAGFGFLTRAIHIVPRPKFAFSFCAPNRLREAPFSLLVRRASSAKKKKKKKKNARINAAASSFALLAPRISRSHFFSLVFTVSLNGRSELKEGLLVVYAQSRCQFTNILMAPDYVNLQRFYGAPTMSIYRDFMMPWLCQFTEILWCPDYVNLQRFYGALTMSIYRDFMIPRLSIYRDFMVFRLCQFTEILHDQAKRVKSL